MKIKTLLRYVCFLALVLMMGMGGAATAGADSPMYDISGIWSGGKDPGGAHFFQAGADVKAIYVNRGFVQYFSGKYVTNTVIEGVWLRKNRGNGCVTKMKERISLSSPDSFSSEWIALDSNCDLAKGRTGSGASNRQKAVEDKLWY